MAFIDKLFEYMVNQGASDLHITSNALPYVRVDGHMQPFGQKPLSPQEVSSLLMEIVPEVNKQELDHYKDTDFAYTMKGLGRFRANVFHERRGMGGVFRHIAPEILTMEQLGLPEVITDLCTLNKGLILVTGPTGSGKSTTLGAMVNHINESREGHLLTLEDPIEVVHENKLCLVRQREVGTHADSFQRALRAALREDPDVLLIGELRDLETARIALETAETGHLVLATLHTTSAVSTVDRLINQFPAGEQQQIRTMLSETLKAVIAQTLCRRDDQPGRVAAFEILLVTTPVANNIREGKIHQIAMSMQTGKRLGMVTLNDDLMTLVKEHVISAEEAYVKSPERQAMIKDFQRFGIPFQPPSTGPDAQR